MRHEIGYSPAYSLLTITLDRGERLRAEAGAMVAMSPSVQVETRLGGGGIVGALKRSVLGGETLFVNDLVATQDGSTVSLAPVLPGDIVAVEIAPGRDLLVQSGSYMASTPDVTVDTKFGGGRAFFSAEGLFLLRLAGPGTAFLASYGAIHQVDLAPGQAHIIDTGHMVAFDAGMGYDVRRAGGSWKTTLVGGEGLVVQVTGPGRFYAQTRSPGGLLDWLVPRIPQRSN